MRAFEFLLEKNLAKSPAVAPAPQTDPNAVPGEPDSDPLYNLKLTIANKIKVMPVDPKTENALHEIEDLLATIGAGTRSEFAGGELVKINDPDVNAAQKLLAKYILSMDSKPADRKAMMQEWAKDDGLIDVKALLTPGKNTVASIVKGYESNPAIKELADDLVQVASLGQGKGEFMLSVFSKRITKAKKGDLQVDGFGQVEVKTTDVGAGRFYDQQVRPTTQYQGSVNDFVKTFKETIDATNLMSTTGISIQGLIDLKAALPPEQRDIFKSKLTAVITNLFATTPELAKPVIDAIIVGNANQAKQRYAVANLNNYTATKTEDKGILMINIAKSPFTFVFFNDNASLNAGGMRLHSSTAYPITNDPRNAYPQTQIVSTQQIQ
jgi:hypothetical protein